MRFAEDQEQEGPTSDQTTPPVSEDLPQEPLHQATLSPEQALEEERARAGQYLANWQRTQADLSNFRKRSDQEREDRIRYANAALMSSVLPVLDDLERALANIDQKLAGLTWIDGIRLVHHRLINALTAHGATPIDAFGKDFDPHEHEAVMYGEGDEGKVVAELQKGYKLHNQLLRPAMVVVGQSPLPQAPLDTSSEEAETNDEHPEQGQNLASSPPKHE